MSEGSDLDRFAALIVKWNASQNLVSRETIGDLWPRHIEDSLQLLPLLGAQTRQVLDVGSGGGFPALPLAIATKGRGVHVTLVEPIAKKAAFLKTVVRELALDATVLTQRIEDVDSRETIDVVTSRALAALPDLLRMTARFAGHGTRFLLHKGRNYRAERDAAAALFDFDMLEHPSRTDPQGVVLEISNLRAKSTA